MSGAKAGTVYAVGAGGLIKIGYTGGAPEKRIGDLRRMNGADLNIVCTWPGSAEDEKSLHTLFAKYRKHGEWFDLPGGWHAVAEMHLGLVTTEPLQKMAEALTDELECCGAIDVTPAMVLDALACAGLTLRPGGAESSLAYFHSTGGFLTETTPPI